MIMSTLEHRRRMPRREEPDGSGPFGGETPIGPFSGFWLLPLIFLIIAIMLVFI